MIEQTAREQAQALLELHRGEEPLVLPNVWDVASARVVAEAGFPVVATSSRAIAAVLGEEDDDTSDPDVIFAFLARIAGAAPCPVTFDLEAGLGLAPVPLVDRLLEAGAVGCNLEDTDHHGDGLLVDVGRQVEFLAAVRAAGDAHDVHVVINARIDAFMHHVGDERAELVEAVARARRYLEAGADCVYPIGLGDRERIGEFVTEVPGPVNVMARAGGLRVAELAVLGVRRISLASGLFLIARDQLRDVVEAFASSGELAQR